jgi:rubrerythrin
VLNNRFNAVEVLEMARDLEIRGCNFYTSQVNKTKREDLKELFLKLAEDEKDHYQRFVELAQGVREETKKEAEYVYDPEVSAYLEGLVEFSIFPREDEAEIASLKEVFKVAISAEKDSILFYKEILEHNQGETAAVLKKLIEEEKKHLLDLLRYSLEFKKE